MTNTENVRLQKIRGLLDTAESLSAQGSTEAAETYREKAFSLMVKYQIDDALVAAAGRRVDEQPVQRRVDTPDPYGRDKQMLLNAVARGLGCQALSVTGARPKHSMVVGFAADLDRVEMLYASLLVQAFGELAEIRSEEVIGTAWRPHSEMTQAERAAGRTSFNKSWLIGFAVRVRERLEEAAQRARQEHDVPGTELVLADRRQQVTMAYEGLFPHRRKIHPTLGSANGYASGQAAGARADIGLTRVGERRYGIEA